LSREGADVALVFLPAERDDAAETARRVEALSRRALRLPGDLRRAGFCRKAVESTIETFGRLDVLVNNAAFQQHQAKLEDLPQE
jgi:NAD(P)-dependent dehydrogenase (short-subunit alcohol dehydrogenase family)